jgi:hypothetical protein
MAFRTHHSVVAPVEHHIIIVEIEVPLGRCVFPLLPTPSTFAILPTCLLSTSVEHHNIIVEVQASLMRRVFLLRLFLRLRCSTQLSAEYASTAFNGEYSEIASVELLDII